MNNLTVIWTPEDVAEARRLADQHPGEPALAPVIDLDAERARRR